MAVAQVHTGKMIRIFFPTHTFNPGKLFEIQLTVSSILLGSSIYQQYFEATSTTHGRRTIFIHKIFATNKMATLFLLYEMS